MDEIVLKPTSSELQKEIVQLARRLLVYDICFSDYGQKNSERLLDLIGLKPSQGYALCLEFGSLGVDSDSDTMQLSEYIDYFTRDLFYSCVIGEKVNNTIYIIVFDSKSSDVLSDRSVLVEKCSVLLERLKTVISSDIRIGIGSYKRTDDLRASVLEAKEAISRTNITVIHYDDYKQDTNLYILIETQSNSKEQYSKTVNKALSYINDHFSQSISLYDVAAAVGVSPNYLSSIFKSEYGYNYIDYLTGLRIQQAKWLLAHTDLSISDIGKQNGYVNSSYFHRIFKRTVGITPSEYRENEKKVQSNRK